ncbi:MAG: hypothetical protein R2911_04905 [Caldilineaceae bacterium]
MGYGVTQVYGPGGLLRAAEDPEFTNLTEPISTLWADTPLNDRNMLCLRSRYDRVVKLAEPPAPPFANFDTISYVESPEGIKFCHGAPRHPYYPEGVVLAYLQNPQGEEGLLFPDLSPDNKALIASTVQNLWSGETPPRVDALLGYQWWPPTPVEGQNYIETAVWPGNCKLHQGTVAALSLAARGGGGDRRTWAETGSLFLTPLQSQRAPWPPIAAR